MLQNKNYSMKFKQQGIALPLTLILLFAMTLLGIATLRTTTLEENMSANSRLRQIAFNAAETTLRDAEYFVLDLGDGDARRELFFSSGVVTFREPDDSRANNGDTCLGGLCIPLQFTSPATPIDQYTPGMERWEDPILDVFNTPNRSMPLSNYAGSDLSQNGVFVAPSYIVEFLGNYDAKVANINPRGVAGAPVRPKFDGQYEGVCIDAKTGLPSAPVWPFCASDPGLYRVTVQATAGPPARRATVTIQSIIRATGS